MKVLGVIPARGDSKGVPRKNLRPLAGRPLIAWSIDSAARSTSLTRVIVSTDSVEIAAVAREIGAEVPFMRPAELAGDLTPDLPVLVHAIDALRELDGFVPDAVVHLRPTQPLRAPGDIDAVVDLLRSSGADSVKSVRPVDEHPHKMWELDGTRLTPYLKTEFRARVGPDYPRQDLQPLYVSSGVVDAVRRDVLEGGSTTGDHVEAYVTAPNTSVDIDTELDFAVAEQLIKEGHR
jgi:CMP-N-acetylneuraminic acid synthetase